MLSWSILDIHRLRITEVTTIYYRGLPTLILKTRVLDFPLSLGGVDDSEKGLLNVENKKDFVRHMLHLVFEESIKDAFSNIADGFDDVLTYSLMRLFFQIIRLDDLDLILRGISNLDVQQWRSHTVYVGYTGNDLWIEWFW